MNTISLESAFALSEKHKTLAQVEVFTSAYTPTQSCAALIVEYAKSLREDGIFVNQNYGAKISSITLHGKTLFQVHKEDSIFVFEEIPKVVLAAMNCKFGDCHKNCINACAVGFSPEAIIHTSEIGILPQEQTEVPGILHSYLEFENQVYDLSYGIILSKPAYDKLFNVKEISSVKVEKVQSDINDGTLKTLSNKDIPTEVYLMARDDCAKMATKGK